MNRTVVASRPSRNRSKSLRRTLTNDRRFHAPIGSRGKKGISASGGRGVACSGGAEPERKLRRLHEVHGSQDHERDEKAAEKKSQAANACGATSTSRKGLPPPSLKATRPSFERVPGSESENRAALSRVGHFRPTCLLGQSRYTRHIARSLFPQDQARVRSRALFA